MAFTAIPTFRFIHFMGFFRSTSHTNLEMDIKDKTAAPCKSDWRNGNKSGTISPNRCKRIKLKKVEYMNISGKKFEVYRCLFLVFAYQRMRAYKIYGAAES